MPSEPSRPASRLRVVEGHRSIADQRALIAHYSAEVCRARPGVSPHDLHHLVSRFVAPVEVAPHVAGAAVDLTLVDDRGLELDLGTPIDATPEQSAGACFFAADNISPEAREHRRLLAAVLGGAGLVNYPTEWWHWSYGDRYWALLSGSAQARLRALWRGLQGACGMTALTAPAARAGGARLDRRPLRGRREHPDARATRLR